MGKLRILSVANFIALAIHISLSYATQMKLLNVKDVGEISNQYPSLFTPANFTFAIWGLIYVVLLSFCIYHIVMSFVKTAIHPANRELSGIGPWFILNNLAAASWLYVWVNNQVAVAAGLIVFQLLTLMIIHVRIGIHNVKSTAGSKIFTQLPLSIYLAWISIATIANIAVYLVSINWDGFGLGYSTATWTRIMIGAAGMIALLVVLFRNNVAFGLVVIWALYGIVSKLETADAVAYNEVIQTAWISIGVTGLVCLIQLTKNLTVKKFRHRFPEAVPIK